MNKKFSKRAFELVAQTNSYLGPQKPTDGDKKKKKKKSYSSDEKVPVGGFITQRSLRDAYIELRKKETEDGD